MSLVFTHYTQSMDITTLERGKNKVSNFPSHLQATFNRFSIAKVLEIGIYYSLRAVGSTLRPIGSTSWKSSAAKTPQRLDIEEATHFRDDIV